MYPISCLINGDVGLLLMGSTSNVSTLLDYNELYRFYMEYPKAVGNALRKYTQEYCRNKMESGTFWYYYSSYTYQDFLATASAGNRWGYTDYGPALWYRSRIAVGYEYFEDALRYTGVTNQTARSGLSTKPYGLRYALPDEGYKKGDRVSLPVSISDTESLSDFGFSVLFPTDQLALNGISFDGSILGSGALTVSIGNQPVYGSIGGYNYTLTRTARGVDVRFVNANGSNFDKVGGLLFNVELTVRGVTGGDYGISIGTLPGVPFLGTSKQVYSSIYRVGLGTENWDLWQWEGDSYPDTDADDWNDWVGGIGTSTTPSITLVASYIRIQESEFEPTAGISAPFNYSSGSLSYTVSLENEFIGTNQINLTAQFDAGALDFAGSEIVIPGASLMSEDYDAETGAYSARIIVPQQGALFSAPILKDILKVKFDIVGPGADIAAELLTVNVTEVLSSVQAETVVCLLEPAGALTYYAPYDMNGDGIVTLEDVSLIIYNFYGAIAGDSKWAAAQGFDVNGDGVVDIFDLMIIMTYIAI